MFFMKSSLFCIGISLLILQSSWAQARERYELYNGVRQLGMGGAAVAVVNDETALLINPAGLGKLRDYIFTLVDPEIDVGAKSLSVVNTQVTKPLNPQQTLDLLNEGFLDSHLHQRAQVFPSLVLPNFGLGVLGKYQVDAKVNSETNTFQYDYVNDFALVLGFNFRLFDGRIKLGFNTRFQNRVEVLRDDIASNSTDLSLGTLGSEGMGVGSDLGIILAAPWALLPTVAAVLRDVGDTKYSFKDGLLTSATTLPETTKQTLDVGVALFPIMGKGVRGTFTADYRDVMNVKEEKDSMRRVHVGAELNLSDILFLRAGMNQRYWTAGAEVAFLNYQLQLASYGEDIGVDEAPVEDRRYVVKFSYRF